MISPRFNVYRVVVNVVGVRDLKYLMFYFPGTGWDWLGLPRLTMRKVARVRMRRAMAGLVVRWSQSGNCLSLSVSHVSRAASPHTEPQPPVMLRPPGGERRDWRLVPAMRNNINLLATAHSSGPAEYWSNVNRQSKNINFTQFIPGGSQSGGFLSLGH